MRRPVASIGLSCLMLVALSGAASASCAESIALLAQQVERIAEASALAADPNAPLGPGDTLVTIENPALKSRASQAFDVFKSPQVEAGDGPDWGFPANLARARELLDDARAAQQRGDDASCQQAVTDGLAAAHRARAWLTRSAASS